MCVGPLWSMYITYFDGKRNGGKVEESTWGEGRIYVPGQRPGSQCEHLLIWLIIIQFQIFPYKYTS